MPRDIPAATSSTACDRVVVGCADTFRKIGFTKKTITSVMMARLIEMAIDWGRFMNPYLSASPITCCVLKTQLLIF
jgi:hypothetical protein